MLRPLVNPPATRSSLELEIGSIDWKEVGQNWKQENENLIKSKRQLYFLLILNLVPYLSQKTVDVRSIKQESKIRMH